MAVDDRSGTLLELAISYTQLGCTKFALRDYEGASHYHKKALSSRLSSLDFYSVLVAESLNYCAESLQALGCGKEALPLAMHAVKIRQQLFGTTHPTYAHALSVLASAYFSVGRPLESLDIMKECIDICEKSFPSNHSNLIPNLMLYAKMLRVSGDFISSLDIYKRALFIHMINFRSNQNELQLIELNTCIAELESSTFSRNHVTSEMPIPTAGSDQMINLIVCSNFHRHSDEFALCVAASLKKMGSLNLISIIAGQPQRPRFALDCLLLSEVPVAFSKSTSPSAKNSCTSPYISCDGVEMITRALKRASSKSVTILLDSCPSDIIDAILKHPVLFTEKVEAVIIIETVQIPRRRSNIKPVATGDDNYDQAMSQVYAACQQVNIPTVSLSPGVARGFPFPSSTVDEFMETNHMLSLEVQQREEAHARRLWEEGTTENRSYIFGNGKLKIGQQSMWPLVKSINVELLLGLLCCIPSYRESHFRWDKHQQVNGIEHKICRHKNAKAGMLKVDSLADEIFMLIGFSMRAALSNTSC